MVFVFQYQLLEQKYRWLFLKKNTSKSKPFFSPINSPELEDINFTIMKTKTTFNICARNTV